MLSEALHGGAVLATVAATATLVVRVRRGRGPALAAAIVMTVAMVDTISCRWVDTVWWVSIQILVAVAMAVAARIAAGVRRAPISSASLHESVALLVMAATMARMTAGPAGAVHHHAASHGLTMTVVLLFLLYGGITVHHVREWRGVADRVHAFLMAGAATMMFAAGWSG